MVAVGASARIQILHVPDCPLVEGLARTLEACLVEAGMTEGIERVVGDFPSPTLVVDGLDVLTRAPMVGGLCCRLDVPTRHQIHAALARLRLDAESRAHC